MTIREVLHKFRNVKPTGDGFSVQCPVHDDVHNSLSMREGDEGRLLLYCHAGCTKTSAGQPVLRNL